MNRTFTRASRRLFIAVAATSLGTVALAQSATPTDTPAPSAATAQHPRFTPEQRQQWRERIAQRRAHHLEKLKTALAITPAQEGAWGQFTTALQPPAAPLQRPAPGQWAALTTPERIDRLEQRVADRQQRLQARGEAVKTFYAQLTPDQQKIFDQRTAHLGGPRMGARHWRG